MQRRDGAVLGLGLALGLGGCAIWRPASYVATTTPNDDRVIATVVSNYLGRALPPGRTTVAIEPPRFSDPPLLDLLSGDLRAQGFGVTQSSTGAPNALPVRLLVTPNFGGYVVRVDYGSQQAGTFIGRDVSGNLQPSSPFVRREL